MPLRRWRPKSIQTSMVLAFVLLILSTTLVLSGVSYYMSQQAVQENAREYTTELIKQVNNNIRSYVSGMVNISELAANNGQVLDYLSLPPGSDPERERKLSEQLQDLLGSMMTARSDIATVNLFGYGGQFVSGRKDLKLNPYVDMTTLPWYKSAQEAAGRNVLSSSHVQPVFEGQHRWVVSLSRELYGRDGSKLGLFLVDLNFSVLNDMLKGIRLGKRGYVFIVDEKGSLVYHPQQQLVYSNVKTELTDQVLDVYKGSFVTERLGEARMYTVQDTGFGWKIVGVSYVGELVGNKAKVRISFLLLGAACVLAAVFLSLFLSNRVVLPIRQLQESMKEVEKGNFEIQVPVPPTTESGRLARTFNIMVGRIKELMDQTIRDQELKRKSELNALQAQITPHFLYNTLDSIVWMAEGKKSEEVVLMTSSLAKLLRASISKGEELVPLATELEHITHYLAIQKMRYRNKLDYRIDVPDEVRGIPVIKVILQPLVENAIYHGIKMKRGPGRIEITCAEMGADLLLFVRDDGIGMEEEKRRALLDSKPGRTPVKGLGVRNVHERLKLYFGEPYGLEFISEYGEGTTVIVRIPGRSGCG